MNPDWNFGKGRCFGGPGGFFGRFGRSFMNAGPVRAARMFASGDLQLIILALLQEKPRHGYEIIKALEQHSSGVYSPSPGVVYPALTFLEEAGYAVSEAEGNKKLYRITDAGNEYLEKNRGLVNEALDQLARFGRKMAQMQQHFTHEEEEESYGHGEARWEAKREWRRMKEDLRDLRHDLKEAIYEKFDASMEEGGRILGILRNALEEIRGKGSPGGQ